MPTHILALLVGALIDLIVGDPEWFYHPVRLIGKFISFAEKTAKRDNPPSAVLRRRAIVVAVTTVLLTALVTAGILYLLRLWGDGPHFVGMALISWMCLSARNLADEAEGVQSPWNLAGGGPQAGRPHRGPGHREPVPAGDIVRHHRDGS